MQNVPYKGWLPSVVIKTSSPSPMVWWSFATQIAPTTSLQQPVQTWHQPFFVGLCSTVSERPLTLVARQPSPPLRFQQRSASVLPITSGEHRHWYDNPAGLPVIFISACQQDGDPSPNTAKLQRQLPTKPTSYDPLSSSLQPVPGATPVRRHPRHGTGDDVDRRGSPSSSLLAPFAPAQRAVTVTPDPLSSVDARSMPSLEPTLQAGAAPTTLAPPAGKANSQNCRSPRITTSCYRAAGQAYVAPL